ncbi:parvulin peptidyl-prolyl isomerase [Bacteroidetes/Chlorobi group bacterium Naka2016]|jgi:peptidyl-prolyl cis-trans isomerase SurA|nr:MAG: parvulin peptidyl-prolyl isomerase [Bacteroidetes/Chlorobi group bacterium Naka2016]
MKKPLLLLFFVFFIVTNAFPQNVGEPLDKIVAIVGDEMILLSDVTAQLQVLAQQDPRIDPNNPTTQRQILDQLINEKLVLIKAKEDSITVTDEEIDQQWDFRLKALIQHYGSEKRIEDIYGMSIPRLKSEYRDEIRKFLLTEKMKEKKFGNIKVSEREVNEFYELYKDSLPTLPEQVELYHIVKNFVAPEEIRRQKFELAKKVRDSIIQTGDFVRFVKLYSDDISSVNSGGELGWVPRGRFFPEFEQAAFNLQLREVSPPIETPLGFHIIQLLGKSKDSILVRHILFKITPSEEEILKTKNTLDSIRTLFYKGTPFEELAKKFSDETETSGAGGFLGRFPIETLPENIRSIVDTLQVGEVSAPVLYKTHPYESYHIIYKKRVIPPHKPTPQKDYRELEQLCVTYKQNKLYLEWINELRKTIYWEIVQ